MTEITPKATQNVVRLTEEQIVDKINRTANAAAGLPEGMDVSRHIATSFGLHYDETGKMDIPAARLQIEVVRAFMNLEGRVVALEQALRDAGISIPAARQTKD